MMKNLFTLLFTLLILASCGGKKEKNPIDHAKSDWAFYQLKGNVKSVEERSFELVGGKKGQRKREIISEHDTDLFFNDEGRLVTEKKWLDNGKLFEQNKFNGRQHKLELVQYINGKPAIKTLYTWHKSGKENTAILRRSPDNTQIDRIAMAYKAGKMIEKRTFNMLDTPIDKIEYIYDAKGNVKEELLYLGSEYVQFRNEYEYNDQHQKISEARFNKDGKLLYKTLYKYENGRLTSSESYNDKNEADYLEKSSYDEKGNVVRHYVFEKFDNAETLDEYTYDAAGNKTQWVATRNGKLYMKANYDYDAHNNLVFLNAVDAEGKSTETRSYKFDYDKTGNWIRKTVLVDKKPLIVTERKISYFEE